MFGEGKEVDAKHAKHETVAINRLGFCVHDEQFRNRTPFEAALLDNMQHRGCEEDRVIRQSCPGPDVWTWSFTFSPSLLIMWATGPARPVGRSRTQQEQGKLDPVRSDGTPRAANSTKKIYSRKNDRRGKANSVCDSHISHLKVSARTQTGDHRFVHPCCGLFKCFPFLFVTMSAERRFSTMLADKELKSNPQSGVYDCSVTVL